jgi:hypothetical protein
VLSPRALLGREQDIIIDGQRGSHASSMLRLMHNADAAPGEQPTVKTAASPTPPRPHAPRPSAGHLARIGDHRDHI